jgi:methionyl aminopeptidase
MKEDLKMITIKSEKDIEKMREACRIVGLAHNEVEKMLKPGMTTREIDAIAEKVIINHGAEPSFKGYPKGARNAFPATACISINEEVIHGIPNNRIIKEGDIVSIDLGAYKNGFHGDAARSYVVGNGTDIAKKLVDVTRESFFEGIKMAKVGNRISDISHAIQEYVEKNGFSVVKEYEGHGIGEELHEEPGVPNFGRPGRGQRLLAGMTIAVEPMVNEGMWEVEVEKNGWTVVTADRKLSAHYENTILITNKGVEVLTLV